MRRMRARSLPLPAPGRWPWRFWRRSALLVLLVLPPACGAGRCRPVGAGALAALLVALRSASPDGRCADRRCGVGGRDRQPAGRPGSSRPACDRVIGLLEASEAARAGPPDGRGHRSPTSAAGRCRWPGRKGGVGLELGQQGAAVAGAEAGGLGQPGAGDGLAEPEVGFEPTTFRLRVGCSASIWTAPDGSSLLTWDASSVQTAPDGYRRIVWMIKWMIKAHPTQNRMPRRARWSRCSFVGASADPVPVRRP